MTSVDIMLAGRVLPGTDPNQAAEEFARISGLDVEVALAAITSGQPRLAIMQGLPPEHGRAWLTRMTAIGIEANLRATSFPADQPCGPSAETPTRPQPAWAGRGRWLDKAKSVPARHRWWTWIRDSWRLVRERPDTWIAVLLTLGGFMVVSGWITAGVLQDFPMFRATARSGVVFAVAAPCLFYAFPLFLGGIALMAHRQLAGEEIRFADLPACCKGEGAGRLYGLCGCSVLYELGVVVVHLVLTERFGRLDDASDVTWVWAVTWPVLLVLAGATAPTLCALGGKKAPAAIVNGIGGAFRNWRAWLFLFLVLFLVCALLPMFTFFYVVPSTAPGVVGKILGTFFVCGCLFLGLTGYMATRDMFYEE